MPPSAIAAVLFDLDGSLVDTEPLHEKATRDALGDAGIHVSGDWFDKYRGRTDRDLIQAILRADESASTSLDDLLAAKADAYAQRVEDVALLPGAEALLDALTARDVRLACVTSATKQDQTLVFRHTGLSEWFDVVVTADDVVHPKPDPQPYQIAMQKLRATPSQCVAVEDAPNGIRSARDAGCTPLGIATSFPEDDLKEAGARFVADTPKGLMAWFEK